MNTHSQIHGTHGHDKTDFQVLSISKEPQNILSWKGPMRMIQSKEERTDNSFFIPLRVFFHTSGSTPSSVHPKAGGIWGCLASISTFSLRWLWEGRPGTPQPSDVSNQVRFWDAFSSPSLPLMATFPSPSAHQMVLSVLVNTDLIWAFSSH